MISRRRDFASLLRVEAEGVDPQSPAEQRVRMRRRVSTAESFGESSGASEKTESDSGFHWAMRRDLAATKDVQEAFFPPESLSIPCMARQTFYEPVHEIGGDYYDFLSL